MRIISVHVNGEGVVEHFHPVILLQVFKWASLTGANPCQMNDYLLYLVSWAVRTTVNDKVWVKCRRASGHDCLKCVRCTGG